MKWYSQIKWQTKTFYLYYHNDYGYQTWQDNLISCSSEITRRNKYLHCYRACGHQNLAGWWLKVDLPVKSHGSCISWSFGILWQIRTIMSLLPQCLYQHTCQVTYHEEVPPIFLSRGLVMLRGRLNTSYFCLQQTIGHKHGNIATYCEWLPFAYLNY